MAVAISLTAGPTGQAASGNVATYSGLSIGAAAADRVVVLFVCSELASSGATGATIDFGGGAVSMNAGTQGNQAAMFARAFWLPVPTGTTATFVVSFGATNPTAAQNHVAVYRLTGSTAVPTIENVVNDTDADPITTASITIPTDGGMLAACADANNATARTWTGLTEDSDTDTGAFRFSSGSSTTAGAVTTTVSGGNNEDASLAYVVFGAVTEGAGTANGSGTATAVGEAVAGEAVGTANGAGTATATGAIINAVSGTLAGAGTAAATGLEFAASVGRASSSDISLLLHFNGIDGSTDIHDVARRYTITVNGNVQLDTAQSVFGGSSALFDGTGDYIQIGG